MLEGGWKIVLGRMCETCKGSGQVQIGPGTMVFASGVSVCGVCKGHGFTLRPAKKEEVLVLLRMIPDLVEGVLEPDATPCSSSEGNCFNLGWGQHYMDCPNY